jgi:hypothetical protein
MKVFVLSRYSPDSVCQRSEGVHGVSYSLGHSNKFTMTVTVCDRVCLGFSGAVLCYEALWAFPGVQPVRAARGERKWQL